MNFWENVLKEIITKVTGRTEFEIEGQNKNLNDWIGWYRGKTNWHQYVANKKTIIRKSSGVAKLMGEDWASNYANENTRITVTSDKQIKDQEPKQNNFIQNLLKNNKVLSRFNTFVEMFMCLGIGATVVMPSKVVYEESNIIKSDADIKITYISANQVIPITIDNGSCIECAFIKYATNHCILQIHLLVEGNYWVVECKGKKNSTDNNYTFNDSDTIIIKTTSTIPFFQIWYPNIKDNQNLDNPLGCSIYADCIDIFKCVDITFDSFFKEFKNGAKKRYVSADLTDVDASGQLTSFTADDEEYVIPQGTDGRQLIQEFNGELRVDAHIKAINFYLNYAAKKCGLGDNRFEFEGTGGRPIQTATGVIAKETALYRNVVKQENFATDRFIEMLMAVKFINNEFTNNPELTYNENEIEVVYDDNIVEDTDSKKKQELAEVQNGIMSLAEFRSHWYDENIETALEFLQKNAMLINIYLAPLQAGAMTPSKFVDLVYGENVEDKNELITYIQEKMSFSNSMFSSDEYQSEEDSQEEEEDKESDK